MIATKIITRLNLVKTHICACTAAVSTSGHTQNRILLLFMQNDLLISYFICIIIMTKLSPDKILSKRTLLAGLLSQRLAARDKKSSTFYLWRAPTSAYFTLYLLAYVAARKKLFRIKVDDKKLKRKAPSLFCFFQVCCYKLSLGHLPFFVV